jgi:CheY-like chemotaxis protein
MAQAIDSMPSFEKNKPYCVMNKSILSVNGHKAMNFVLQTIFDKGYDFVPVADAFQALHHLRSNKRFKILLVDVDFQSQQSWELIEHVRSSTVFTEVLIMILTTENSEAIRQKCYELQIDEIFFKPFNPVDVIAAVKSSMSTHLTNA